MSRSRARLEKPNGPWSTRRHSFITSLRADEIEGRSNVISDCQEPERLAQAAPSSTSVSDEVPRRRLLYDADSEISSGHIIPERHRFSFLAKRHVSDPQISKTARAQATLNAPPVPAPAPSIVTTAPSSEAGKVAALYHPPLSPLDIDDSAECRSGVATANAMHSPLKSTQGMGQSVSENDLPVKSSRVQFHEPARHKTSNIPPAYGDEITSSLALPISRLSESSKSDTSLSDHVYASTTTQTVSTTTTFFRLPRRKKKTSLFPLPLKIPPADRSSTTRATPPSDLSSSATYISNNSKERQKLHGAVAQSPVASGQNTAASYRSGSPFRAKTLPPESYPSKVPSLQTNDEQLLPTPILPSSTRTSTSTTRTSLGGLFNITRLRQNSEPQARYGHGSQTTLPATPLSTGSKSHLLAREPLILPPRLEGDTPAKYLMRLEDMVDRGTVAAVLAQSDDEFFGNVLRSYMRGFKFFGDPLDMSIRKLLMVAELPKETQQIDRVLQAFANRYHECNPGIFATPDEAYFISFSLLILHTDVFNKNNRNKMQKLDYTKNTRGSGVADEILECFYDNITYTPFIRVEDDSASHGDRHAATKPKKSLFTKQSTDAAGKPSREPVDPYTFILDNRLDHLRPSLKEVMNLENPYTYLNQGVPCHYGRLYRSFFKYGDLQIVSSRSRPEAFMTPETVANPAGAHPGVVDVKVTKAGILWRKDPKKKKARSPWQEWGAILTGTQLYFFRNSTWVKSLMHQHDAQVKRAKGVPIIFRPPLENFKPDVLMSTEDAVALQDLSYKKHKNAFVFIRRGGLEEVLLADSESDLNDWLSNLNYAAAFHTAGVRIRQWEAYRSPHERRASLHSQETSHGCQASEVGLNQTALLHPTESMLTRQIQDARRQVLLRRIGEAVERLKDHHILLENQLRNARHLQTLAPIQNRSREQVVLAAGAMSARIKWTQIEIWRSQCHHDIWVQDLDDEVAQERAQQHSASIDTSIIRKLPSFRSESLATEQRAVAATTATKLAGSDAMRPTTQPAHATVDVDGLFDSLHGPSTIAGHKSKGSWELPPLSFQPATGSFRDPRPPREASAIAGVDHTMVDLSASHQLAGQSRAEQTIPHPLMIVDGEYAGLLREGEGFGSERSVSSTLHRSVTPTSYDGDRVPPSKEYERSDAGEAKTKARRSFQRSLRDHASSTPSHNRGKRGKESSNSAGNLEGDGINSEAETLARTHGSFTLHGKKASVVDLGYEWQTLSNDRQRHTSGELVNPRLISLSNSEESTKGNLFKAARPASTCSVSTNGTDTATFEDAVETSVEIHEGMHK